MTITKDQLGLSALALALAVASRTTGIEELSFLSILLITALCFWLCFKPGTRGN